MLEADVQSFFDEEDLSVQSDLFMTFAKLFVDFMCSAKPAYEIEIDPGNAFQHECPQGTIVDLPDLGASSVECRIGAWNASVQPLCEGLSVDHVTEAEIPIFPIRLAPVEDEVGGPSGVWH